MASLAAEVFSGWAECPRPQGLPQRIGHGDPKAANILFDPTGPDAWSLIDLDTVAWTSLELELGDAMRSWTRVDCEDEGPAFSVARFESAMVGYVGEGRDSITAEEVNAVVAGLERIGWELTARFACDALEECYFGWDPSVATTRGAHNLLRAREQLRVVAQVVAQRPTLERMVAQIWG